MVTESHNNEIQNKSKTGCDDSSVCGCVHFALKSAESSGGGRQTFNVGKRFLINGITGAAYARRRRVAWPRLLLEPAVWRAW